MIWAYISAAAMAAALATGAWLGYKHMQGEVYAAEAKAELAAETSRLYQKSLKQADAKEIIVTRYVNKIVEVQGAVREVFKDAPPVVCEQGPAGVAVLNSAFRVQHDRAAAAATRAYQSSGDPDATTPTAETISPEEALNGIAANYASCALNALTLIGLQEYVNEIQATKKKK